MNLYQVIEIDTQKIRLVEAGSAKQAVRYVAEMTFTAKPADAARAHELAKQGVEIETVPEKK